MNENIIIINTIMEILDQQAEKGKGMRMMLVNSSLAFFFFPPPQNVQRRHNTKSDVMQRLVPRQLRSSHCLCLASSEILLLLPCKKSPPLTRAWHLPLQQGLLTASSPRSTNKQQVQKPMPNQTADSLSYMATRAMYSFFKHSPIHLANKHQCS